MDEQALGNFLNSVLVSLLIFMLFFQGHALNSVHQYRAEV